MHSPVLLPARLCRLRALRPFLSVTDSIQSGCRRLERLQVSKCGRGSPLAEAEVVLRRAALVAMAFQHDDCGREIRENRLQRLSVFRQSGKGSLADVALV